MDKSSLRGDKSEGQLIASLQTCKQTVEHLLQRQEIHMIMKFVLVWSLFLNPWAEKKVFSKNAFFYNGLFQALGQYRWSKKWEGLE